MSSDSNGYGLSALVVINTIIFVVFALSFTRPHTARDWRSFGAFSAFIIALFTEMYGFPLTIYLLSGWLGSRYPVSDPLSHDNGHLWDTLLGLGGNPHVSPLHLLSNVAIGAGLVLLAVAWSVLHRAQREHRLASTGPYSYVRHPQYAAFVVVMVGFLLQWPTLITLAMFPILVVMYVRLAKREEMDAAAEFGDEYRAYAAITPRFIPRRGGRPVAPGPEYREVRHGPG
jgi:protein-S-isoprenylcysteine O-methyltransferase Ste14